MAFHGQLLRQRRTAAFHLTETVFGRGEEVPWHTHEIPYISFLLAGAYAERTGTSERVFSMGTVIWHSPGEAHSDRFCTEGGHLLNLEFGGTWLQRLPPELASAAPPSFSRGGLPYSLGLRLHRCLNTGSEAAEDLALELLSLYTSSGDGPDQPEWLRHVLELIYEERDQRLTLVAAAAAAGVHPVHVSRTFRRVLGCTFSEYVGQVRLRRAFDLLHGSAESLVDVAVECGFADHAHMCRSFKRSTGITPSTYRTRFRG